MKIVCYGVVTDRRDAFRDSPYPMVLFTDDPTARVTKNVRIVPCPPQAGVTPVRTARFYSANPHLLFPDADVTIYMNGSVRLAVPPERIVEIMGPADMACFKHDRRDCLYEEGYEVARQGIDDPAVVEAQLARYRDAGHPRHWGLWGLSLYVRRHTDRMRALNEAWYEEIKAGSFRDQISFPFVVRKTGVKIAELPGTQDQSELHTLARHSLAPRRWPGADIDPGDKVVPRKQVAMPPLPAAHPNRYNIQVITPYSCDYNLGAAYNKAMLSVPDDGWGCLLDHDIMFTTRTWYRQLEEAIAVQPAGSFTAGTNRIRSKWQTVAVSGDDIGHHRRIGESMAAKRTLLDVTDTAGWGGVLMLVSKASWRAAGGFPDGLFCVDHLFHFALKAAGRRVWLIEGLYVYHWRGSSADPALFGNAKHHAVQADGSPCPCRDMKGAEPTRRVGY